MARGDQLARQWRILQSLIASRRGKSAADLAQELEYHWRAVYRDLEALQMAGFPIFTDRVDGKNLWSVLDSARNKIPIPLDLTELMALYFSRGLMMVLKDTVFYESLESFFQKIKATLPAETIRYLDRSDRTCPDRATSTRASPPGPWPPPYMWARRPGPALVEREGPAHRDYQ